ncbi:MAG: uracil-DNA glycosylase family protein [Acidobacteria bacterium]|nr:MAG: uracil-DNA glycosylase family protein [Acidobacteriota bacterium]REK01266.1 MAG: uracil-DNA glycosylase family protein [Acidobacteriota bacterium]REK14222.1 MAG: uracil-DNA glycosylase family protein [Acidobacteriota bacterium]REK44937.1 MAG: uracil-DNA glycosylase family protein [Acidobacteriota bacterium]
MKTQILKEIRSCNVCEEHLPHGPRPVISFSRRSKIAIIGQAPGRKVHESGVPWDDPSGDRLREWLGVSRKEFYDPDNFAIVPMGLCYPGKGKSGDLPPRPECAPLWHPKIFGEFVSPQMTLLVGGYSQAYYLSDKAEHTLTENVMRFRDFLPGYLPLPHPSPRNNIWMRKNPWFEAEVLPVLKEAVRKHI